MSHSECDRSRHSTLLLLQFAATCDDEAFLRNRIAYQLTRADFMWWFYLTIDGYMLPS